MWKAVDTELMQSRILLKIIIIIIINIIIIIAIIQTEAFPSSGDSQPVVIDDKRQSGADLMISTVVCLRNEKNSSNGYYDIKNHVVIGSGRARNMENKNKPGIEGVTQES
jgi:hypothetical protein